MMLLAVDNTSIVPVEQQSLCDTKSARRAPRATASRPSSRPVRGRLLAGPSGPAPFHSAPA
jgi:hypothetical protein